MQREYVEQAGRGVARSGKAQRSQARQGKGLPQQSVGEAYRFGYLAGLKDAWINGRVFVKCERCGRRMKAAEVVTMHRLARTKGRRARPGHPGIDARANIDFGHEACHQADHPGPWPDKASVPEAPESH
jgi:hypothetical protein